MTGPNRNQRGRGPPAQRNRANISISERRRRQLQSQWDKMNNSFPGPQRAPVRRRPNAFTNNGRRVTQPNALRSNASRPRRRNARSSAQSSASAVNVRHVSWKLPSVEPTRAHECVCLRLFKFPRADEHGHVDLGDISSGTIDDTSLFYVHGNFRATNIWVADTVRKNIAIGGFSSALNIPAVDNNLGEGAYGPDPNKFVSATYNAQYRVSHAYFTIRVTCCPGTMGDVVIQHATSKLIGDSQSSAAGGHYGETTVDIRNAMINERHSTIRIPFHEPKSSPGFQKTFAMPLCNPESYGNWSSKLKSIYQHDGQTDPFGGFLVCFDCVTYSHFNTPPSVQMCVTVILEEELSMATNDLACNTPDKTVIKAKTDCMAKGGMAGGKDTTGRLQDCHGKHHNNSR